MSAGRGAACVFSAGATLFAVGGLFHLAVPAIAPSIPPQFEEAALFRPWAGWTSTYMALHPFGFGAAFAAAYLGLWARCGSFGGWRGGLAYGAGLFLVGALPVYLLAYASFRVSPEVIASWTGQAACQYSAAGAAVGWIARRPPNPPLQRPGSGGKLDSIVDPGRSARLV